MGYSDINSIINFLRQIVVGGFAQAIILQAIENFHHYATFQKILES